jgi:hypothetical protein
MSRSDRERHHIKAVLIHQFKPGEGLDEFCAAMGDDLA